MTMRKSNIKADRRGFLRTALRLVIASGAAIGGAALYKRNGGPLAETACRDPKGRTGCAACGLLASCGLPRGLSYKQVRKEGGHGG